MKKRDNPLWNLTDAELVTSYRSYMPTPAPETVTDELMRRCERGVVPVARRMRGAMSAALSEDDLVQVALFACFRKLNRVRGSLGPWAARVAQRMYLDLIRVRGNQKIQSLDLESGEAQEPKTSSAERLEDWRTADPADAVIEVESMEQLRAAIANLPPMYRVVVTQFLDGKSIVEIADMLHRRPGAVRWRYQRAVNLLRQELEI